ncbi:Hypothetical predicted protein, partial [Paramuricea clavata]
MTDCLSYFSKSLAKINPNKLFVIPSWIPKLSDPEVQFNLDPPTYQQITNVIRKMKSSGSPCPLDQLSIISFKHCPYLRTYLIELIHDIWLSGTVPTEWKRACTILIHKKGNNNDPSNFRPITLESIPLKVFTSCFRNAVYSFLASNNFVEHNIQKGFTPNLSGTLEHTAQMADIINKARIRQRSVVITLLDLKNAFGEIHHNLIQSVLDYHHTNDYVKFVIKSLYTDFQTSIITSEFRTPFMTVGRGVLQGDCLSPLLFNMCFNTFIQHIKAEKYRQFGRYVLPKLAWHFTVATLSKTWVTENIDSIANKYIRRWLEVPISGTLSTVFLTNNKFGLSIYPPSVKFIQCQTVLRKALKSSPNESTNDLWRATSNHTNIQYDAYNSTKEVLKNFRSGHENKLLNQLTSQGSFFCSVTKFALPQLNKVWSIAQSKLPKNIYNFTIRYINNSLPTRKNLNRWAISSNSDCSFCLSPETLLHIVAGCQYYLDRFTWRHNSVLNFLAHTLQTVDGSTLYADLNGFKSPSILTGDTYCPDLLLSCSNGSLYVVELTTGYETNLKNNVKRKKDKYRELLRQLDMLDSIGLDKNHQITLEHTAQMTNIINQVRIKQRSVVITLLDLKNAFGEVHHNLIQSVLDYHHIPKDVSEIIKSLYTDFNTAFITSEFSTPFITVGRGVLQGDCLSPLIFNMCINTFIQHIKTDKYRQFGFITNLLNPVHWFQFADDAAVISGQDSENQHLLNRFSIWCQWSNMIVRVDKCSTFGIRKSLTKSIQYLPKLLINNELIPATKIGESFRYLGKYFDFSMSEKEHKQELITLMDDIMSEIDLKPLHPKNKLLLYSRYLLSKLSWHFTVTTLSKTWDSENMDSVVNKYVRKWLEIPISGTLSNVYLTSNKFGLNIYPPSIKLVQCQTVARNALKTSPNHSIKDLWKTTSKSKKIQYDVYTSTKKVLKTFTSGQEDKLQNHLILQGSFFSNVIKFSLSKLN